ncbi:MAG: beta-galactosidase [Planctomycetota bacterium]
MKFGVAYYPEHWPEDRWETDAELMKDMQLDVVRVGEFAWSRLEPRRGRFEMDWLERAVEVLSGAGLDVVLCTPTAAPPAWLFHRHPDMAPVDRQGHSWHQGSRSDACINNRPYRKYVRRIVTRLARTFRDNPHITAWQVDDELGSYAGSRCYCDYCEHEFHQWLKGRYGSIDRLNKKWGTVFWSQEFTNWHEVPVPRRTPGQPHPSLLLDYNRFISSSYREFLKQQADIIRDYAGQDSHITTNSLGLGASHVDLFSLETFQDETGVDNYPLDERGVDETALSLDLARSMSDDGFWVLEQQAGATTSGTQRSLPRAGQLRLWSYQAALRGAELISYFRWRTAPFGQEMHWDGLLRPDGSPSRNFEEVRNTIGELKEKASLWEGKAVESRVGLIYSYPSQWALSDGSLGMSLDYRRHVRTVYRCLRRMGMTVDFLEPGDVPEGYDVVIMPMPFVCPEEAAGPLEVFVVNGGSLLATAPAGYRTLHNTARRGGAPGPLRDVLGVEVRQHDLLGHPGMNAFRFDDEEEEYECGRLCSLMDTSDARPLARYDEEFYAGSPAVTVRSAGSGKAFFLGSTCGEDGLHRVISEVLESAGIEPHPWASERVEVVPLDAPGEEGSLLCVLNHGSEPVELTCEGERGPVELVSGDRVEGSLRLDGYGVAMLTRK